MPSFSPLRRRLLIAAMAVFLSLAVVVGYRLWRSGLPGPGSSAYEKYVEAFQVGVAALDADLPQVAEEHLTRAVEWIPQEPAGWANRGLLYLRTGRLPEAARDLQYAESLAPNDPAIHKLLGLLAQRRGQFGEATAHLRRAVELDRDDVKALYSLAQILDQDNPGGNDAERQRLTERILALQPNNLYVLVERLRLATRQSDAGAVRDTLEQFRRLAPGWSEPTRIALGELESKLNVLIGPDGLLPVLRFSNLLRREPAFPRNAAEVAPPNSLAGDSLLSLLCLIPVQHAPAPIDVELTFTPEPLPQSPAGVWDVVLPVWLTGEGQPAVFVANSKEIRRTDNESTLPSIPVSSQGVIPLDWNNDLRTDLLLAGAVGLRFYQQQEDGTLDDTTVKTQLPDDLLHAEYHGALAADVDLDGDMDVLLARRVGPPWFFRNNFDGTFTPQAIFSDMDGPQTFAWADFDHDGAPDAALLDAHGRLRVFANERMAVFREWPVPPPVERFLALAIADANEDGVLDIVTVRDDGVLSAISDREKRSSWAVTELGRWEGISGARQASVPLLLVADLDNNGAPDLLISDTEHSAIWLGVGAGKFQTLRVNLPPRLSAVADLRGEGRIDLLGLDQEGRPLLLRNTGRKNYHWQTIRPRAVRTPDEGDNRINSYGIGGEIELRTGTHVVKQAISGPVVHFGLGQRSRSDVLRIVWPNGTSQVEFQSPINQTVEAVQRLKGSCPFLFAWNGQRFEFVTDFMWSTPLGMYINAGDKGGFLQTTDWVKIPGDRLTARDGCYELRVNANLWETHFIDHLALLVVDHAPGTEMFVDERFYLEPAEPAFHLTEEPRRVARAWDHQGRDATNEVREVDGVYLDRCGRGAYQGVTQNHWVEVDLGDNAPSEGPLWLVARGWIHPTDSSINYALEQGKHDHPRGLTLEVPDGHGGWKPGREQLGFPAGKDKTILVRLDGVDGSGVSRRFRLRTNMEIYWDALEYARGRDEAPATRQRLLPYRADLRFRGIVAMTQANASSPELPHYDQVVSRGQYWRDLVGYYTRYGDIRELLEQVDDRYAILSGGDEMVLRFTAPAEQPPGWKRDFVWVADGWVKDGDFNTRFGKTVLPLPAHDMQNYRQPPNRLEDDPVYRRHAKDWEIYHTRYVTPHFYEQGLRPFSRRDALLRIR